MSVHVPVIIGTLDNIVKFLDHVVDIGMLVKHYPPLLFNFSQPHPWSGNLQGIKLETMKLS